MTQIVNAKGRPFTWSYSSLTDYEGCPARYAAKRFYCTTKEAPTEATIWGERVHKAFEERIRDGKEFDEDLVSLGFERWAKVLEALPGGKQFERKFAIRENQLPCEFYADDAWGRGIVDLLVIDGDTASLVDYKTGKQKEDKTQLELFSWFVMNEFPQVRKMKYRYIWLKPGTVTGGELNQMEAKMVMIQIEQRVRKMEYAWQDQNFPCFPSGLCRGWCHVEECMHFQPRRER